MLVQADGDLFFAVVLDRFARKVENASSLGAFAECELKKYEAGSILTEFT